VVVGVALAAVALLVTACGGSSGPEDRSAGERTGTSAGGPAGTSGASTFTPVTIEHRYGSTEISERPQRIVSLDAQWTDALIALDAPPVGYIPDPTAPDGFPWRGDALDGSTPMPATDALPYEQIVALEPDLIVVAFFAQDQTDYDTLSAIAPTVATLSENQVDPWQEVTRAAGDVLGQQDAAAALVADVDGQVAALAEELPGLEGKTFALVNYVPGDSFYVVSDPDDGAVVLFDQLGLQISPSILEVGGDVSGRVKLSLEQTQVLDADVLILFANGADPTEIPGYSSLPAVTSGAVAELDYVEVLGLNTPSPLSLPYSLDFIRPALDAAAR
jgi:iron complex transport system substrate-binding protein